MRFSKVLIANRGEIARRVIRTCREHGYETVAVYSEADEHALFVADADEAILIGEAPAAESYLDSGRILQAAKRSGAQAIHPGYGFLSENAAFATACADAHVVFIGPSPESIRAMGSKIEAKALMSQHGVPIIPGYDGADQDPKTLAAKALEVGFPVLLKASAGGGGKGMRVVRGEASLAEAIESAAREALAAFSDGTLLIEKYIETPRHIEFQIVGDEHGNLIHCFERECSIQRRHQKIIEETPAVGLSDALREEMGAAALKAGKALGYRSAGTVEFIVAPDGAFYFLEVNTRLQVEHAVTEETTGLDLVAIQLDVAQGRPLAVTQTEITQRGHSIECRIYAEDPANDFLPATGRILHWSFPEMDGLRLDSGVGTGSDVGIYYDPMLAKVITKGSDRAQATARMIYALKNASIVGLKTNRAFLIDVLTHPRWERGQLDTHFIEAELPAAKRLAEADPLALRDAIAVATAASATARKAGRRRLPNLPMAYRNNPWRDAEERWEVDGVRHDVSYADAGPGATTVVFDDVAILVTLADLGNARLRVCIDGHTRSFTVIDEPMSERVIVQCGVSTVELKRIDRFPEAAADDQVDGCLAPMPGKVLSVKAKPGDSVEEGQTLVILEAMKMEHAIAAPKAGVVATILVEEGDLVDAAAPLFHLEAE